MELNNILMGGISETMVNELVSVYLAVLKKNPDMQ